MVLTFEIEQKNYMHKFCTMCEHMQVEVKKIFESECNPTWKKKIDVTLQ